jgi:hypothetical protein
LVEKVSTRSSNFQRGKSSIEAGLSAPQQIKKWGLIFAITYMLSSFPLCSALNQILTLLAYELTNHTARNSLYKKRRHDKKFQMFNPSTGSIIFDD